MLLPTLSVTRRPVAPQPTLVRSASRFSRGKKGLPPWDKGLDHVRSNPLFRTPPPAVPIDRRHGVQPHPVFRWVKSSFRLVVTDIKHADIWVHRRHRPEWESRRLRAASLPVMKDFATFPATREVVLHFSPAITYVNTSITVKNPSGVTILDVLKASTKLWSSAPPPSVALATRQSINDGMLRNIKYYPDYDELSKKPVTWYDALLDHVFFEGWCEVKVVRKDRVRFSARYFGS
ncbi:hypothetical protein JCM8097_008514 [Rhodosporidiobolus ruineniae]